MITKTKFIELMISIQRTSDAFHKLGKLMGNIVIDCDLTAFMDKSETIISILLNIPKEQEDIFAECFWDLLFNGQYKYYIDDIEFICDSWNKFYEEWANK